MLQHCWRRGVVLRTVAFPGVALAALMLLGFAGCGDTASTEEVPKTHPVKGRVVMKNGTPMKMAVVQFTAAAPTEGPNPEGQLLPAIGRTDANGNYTLELTLADGTKVEGAMPGQYNVSISPDAGADQTQFDGFEPIDIPGMVTVPAANDTIDITVPK